MMIKKTWAHNAQVFLVFKNIFSYGNEAFMTVK